MTDSVKDTRITTKALCLVLSLGMAAGTMPISALAEATPETAAAYEISDETLEEAPPSQPASPETAQVPQLAKVAVMSLTDPAVGDEIVIDQVTYRITKLPTASSNGKLTLVDGKNVTGDLIVANGMEYAGGKYDVTELGYAAFMDNTALTSVDLSDTSVSAVGQNCFRDCTALYHVDFAENTITNLLKTGVFAGCTSLTSLEIAKANISGKSPFSGSSIRTMTIYAFSGSGDASEFSGLPEGFTLNCPGSLSTYQLNKNAFGTTKNVTLNVATKELQAAFAEQFAGKSVTVKLFGEAETVASVSDSTGTVTGYASLEDAIRAVNDSQDQGPFTITTRSSGELIEWNTDLAPAKETVIDFAGCSVDLPDTLTLQAPLTIRSVTNFDTEGGLCTVDAGEYAFVMIDGGSFGFAEIKGSDLHFEGTLPGGLPLGQQVRLTGEGEAATVEFSGIGSSEYYYDLPNMSGFTEVELQNSYLEADRSETFHGQLEDVDTVTMDDGGLKLNADASIGTLSGRGELRFAEGAALEVTDSADGSFTLPEFEGSDLTEVPLTLPEDSDVKLTNKDGTEIVAEAVASVEGLGSFSTLADAFEAIRAGEADSYTLTLLGDVTLEATAASGAFDVAELPAKALVIDGNGHTLTAGDAKTRNYVYAAADLTLQNVKLNMPKTYLRITGEGATVTVAGSVTGDLEKIDASVKTGCTVVVQAPVSDSVIDGIAGTSPNKMKVVLNGYGSNQAPAAVKSFPTVSNSSGTTVLENSWLVGDSAANLGAIEIRQGGGLSLTGTMANASVKGWTVEEGVVADLTVKSGKLTINGAVSGKTQIHFAGNPATAEGGIWVKAANAGPDSFVLADDAVEKLDGLLLRRDANGNFVLQAPVMSVQGGTLPDEVNFASWEEAAALLEKMSGSTDSYTLTLKDDLTLPEGAALPDVVLTIDGKDGDASYTLSVDQGKALKVQNSLTLQNLVLDMDDANVEYVRASDGEKTLTIAATVTGNVGQIVDSSRSRWLDICLQSSSLAFDKIIGTTSTIDTQLTDLILTGLGSKEDPLNLTGKVENLAAVEINNSWLTASGDASGLGTIRTDYTKQEKTARTGGLILTGDTILKALSITENDDFELWMPAGAVLTVNKEYTISKRQVPVYVVGTLQDGWALIKAPDNGNKNAADYCLANAPAGVLLYWDEADHAYKVSYAPEVAMSADAASYKDYYTKVILTLADGQGIAAVTVNGTADPSYTVGETQYLPDTARLEVGENTVVVTDVTGNSATFTFRYDRPADYTDVEKALAGIPADLTGYTAGSVQAVRNAVNAVVYGAGHQDQADVDGMALAIRRAVEGLTRAMGTASSQNQDQHPEIAEAIKNGTWGKEDNTSKPAQQASGTQATVPQTSDTENVTLWVALMAISLVGLAGLGIRTIKRRKETR